MRWMWATTAAIATHWAFGFTWYQTIVVTVIAGCCAGEDS